MTRVEAGKVIRVARIKAGMTQDELARKLKVSQATVGCWEIGYTMPRPKSLVKLCELLDIPVDSILRVG